MQNGLTPDVVVLGAGLSGMCAATAASEEGVNVLMLERAPVTGGSAAISGGYVWTAPDLDGLPQGGFRASSSGTGISS